MSHAWLGWWLMPWLLLMPAPPVQSAVAALPEFRVLVDDAHPPFSYLDQQGKPQGLSVQILRAVLAKLALNNTIEATPWRRAVLLAARAPNVLLASVMELPERKSQYVWIAPLFSESIWLYSLRHAAIRVPDIVALNRYRIGTPRDSAAYRQLLRIGVLPAQIDPVSDPIQNLRKLQAGRLDLITMQPAILAWHGSNLGIAPADFEPVYPLLPKTRFYLAASLGTDPALIRHLQATIQTLEADGSLDLLRSAAGLPP